LQEFKLPNLGEGVEKGDVLSVLVKPGDRVKQDQPVLELETDKATIEVPSSVDGVVKELKVKAGDKVKPGQVVFTLEAADGAAAEPKPKAAPEGGASASAKATADKSAAPKETAKPPASAGGQPADKSAGGQQPTPEKAGSSAPTEKQEEPPADEGDDAEGAAAAPPDAPKKDDRDRRASVVDIRGRQPAHAAAQAPIAQTAAPPSGPAAPAAPSVRRLAREIGIDIAQVTGSGPGGRISETDVKEFARHVMSSLGGGAIQPAQGRPAVGGPALPDFSKWGEIERKDMSGIRRKTAEHLSHAWNAIPHVTQFDKADMTTLESIRPKYGPEVEKAGGKLTVTAVVAKILASALKKFPQFNASVDMAAESIIYKKYVNIGIAVDTENGLLVPVVRNADQKNIVEIAVEIQQLSEKARARKLSRDEMSGGSMSISNLGGIGGTSFTPIVNWPEVAILGISRGSVEAVFRDGKIEPRQMLPLSLSYDHRVIDGADAIRFLRWVVEAIEQPFTLALRG
jgi:pyruvate dehydrogenase E2 component (dihydrolipoamide acetyltransferase)